ncbi:acyl-homoserine-lactone synthase [Lentilitoribacter sp. Alg239-R112]|uniref:acyl-homoserine-lactone synthase n=1 Tax=Lentilitoribacter sp. Alg239-R112 TaxID=2305987 RepID=UPI0013A6A87E|nr:acyl-homoserine-lactone synthase [Lentilitoribacter sp. Alg239-R112]
MEFKMLEVIDRYNFDLYQSELESIYRYRHWYFVDRLDWKAIYREDGREIDDYDNDDAIHLAKLKAGRVVSYTRLIPTNRPHLLSHVYPEIMDGQDYETGKDIYEWTRFSVDPEFGNLARLNDETMFIFHGIAEYCVQKGIRHLIVETHPIYITWLSEMGWDTTPISKIKRIDGKKVVAFTAAPTVETVRIGQELLSLDHSVLSSRTEVQDMMLNLSKAS